MEKLNKKHNENENLISSAIQILQKNKSGLYSENELLVLISAIESFQ